MKNQLHDFIVVVVRIKNQGHIMAEEAQTQKWTFEKEVREQTLETVRTSLIEMQLKIDARICLYDHEVYAKEGGLEALEEALEQISKLNKSNS